MSSQLSKAVERLLGHFFLPFLVATGAFGPNQFAYTKERGCKDALALNTLQWLWAFNSGKQVGVYCSDVSGAFDRVETGRLLNKLRALGVGDKLLKLVGSWLEDREAVVIVDGRCSKKARLTNMVYQGTVWGPPLWNSYFGDARRASQLCRFSDKFFADDLTCSKNHDGRLQLEAVKQELEECQATLHEWGAANQVVFDAGKESFHVLHRRKPYGESFKTLGVHWDTKLKLDQHCHEQAVKAS